MKKFCVYVKYEYVREVFVSAESEDIAEDIAIQTCIDNPIDICSKVEPYVDYTSEEEK